MMRLGLAYVLTALLGLTNLARADALRVDQSAETMRVDGALREWKGAHFSNLGDGDDAALRFALASQGEGLYVAAEVRDDQLLRKAGAGAGQDALVFGFALSDGGALHASEVWLHAGRVGHEKALGAVRALPAKGSAAPAPEIKVVEGPASEGAGYVLEAFIPWRLVGASADNWEQARAVLRYEDCDRAGEGCAQLRSSDEAAPERWPPLTLGTGQLDLLATFLKAQGLSGITPRFDARADVAGDALQERVVIVDKFVLVYGKHFKDGQSYAFYALPYSVGGGLVSAELVDFDQDGHAELLTRVRQSNELGARVLASVLALREENIVPIFGIELRKETRDGFIENELRVDKKSKPPQLQVNLGRAQGLNEQNYRESPANDVTPILLPWGKLEASSYAFRDGKFECVAQRENKRYVPSPSAQPVASTQAAASEAEPAPAAAAPGDAIAALILAAERGNPPKGALRFQQQVNVLGGPARERVFVAQRRIIVSGPEVGANGSYLAYGVPVSSDDDLINLDNADLGGDGRFELLARYRQTGNDGVGHDMLAVLAVEASASARGFRPLLLAEVARRQGERAITNQVSVQAGVLTIAPGKAQGYTRDNYPFSRESGGNVEPVLLPWADAPRRYRLEAGRLRAE